MKSRFDLLNFFFLSFFPLIAQCNPCLPLLQMQNFNLAFIFQYAVSQNDPICLQRLLRNFDVDAFQPPFVSITFEAARRNQVDVIRSIIFSSRPRDIQLMALLSFVISLDITETALLIAMSINDWSIVSELSGQDVVAFALRQSAESVAIVLTRRIFSKKANQLNWLLAIAAKHGRFLWVRYALQHFDLDPSVGDFHAILVAADYQQSAIVQMLLRHPKTHVAMRKSQINLYDEIERVRDKKVSVWDPDELAWLDYTVEVAIHRLRCTKPPQDLVTFIRSFSAPSASVSSKPDDGTDDSNECTICADGPINCRFEPCSHRLCFDCAEHISSSTDHGRCPFCRRPIVQLHPIGQFQFDADDWNESITLLYEVLADAYTEQLLSSKDPLRSPTEAPKWVADRPKAKNIKLGSIVVLDRLAMLFHVDPVMITGHARPYTNMKETRNTDQEQIPESSFDGDTTRTRLPTVPNRSNAISWIALLEDWYQSARAVNHVDDIHSHDPNDTRTSTWIDLMEHIVKIQAHIRTCLNQPKAESEMKTP
jgi:hypothetical protein